MTSLKWTRVCGWGSLTQEEASFSLEALGSAHTEVTSLLAEQLNRDKTTAGVRQHDVGIILS